MLKQPSPSSVVKTPHAVVEVNVGGSGPSAWMNRYRLTTLTLIESVNAGDYANVERMMALRESLISQAEREKPTFTPDDKASVESLEAALIQALEKERDGVMSLLAQQGQNRKAAAAYRRAA